MRTQINRTEKAKIISETVNVNVDIYVLKIYPISKNRRPIIIIIGIIIKDCVSVFSWITTIDCHVIAAEIIRHSTNKHFTKNVLSFRGIVRCITKNSLSNCMVILKRNPFTH